MTRGKTLLADAGLLYAAAIWGATFFMVKGVLDHVSPLGLIGYRFVLAAVLLLPVLWIQKRTIWAGLRHGLALGFFLWLIYVPQTIGLKYTTASNSGFITGLFTVFVPFFALLFLRQFPGPIKLVSICIAVLGLWVLTGGIHGMNKGDALTLLAAMGYAVHILLADKSMKQGLDPVALSFQQFLFVGVFSFVAGWIFGIPVNCNYAAAWQTIVFLAVFPTILAFLVQLVAQRFTSPIKVALIFSMEPVFAALFAWTLGGEPFVLRRAAGGLLIVFAMILSELPIGRKRERDLHPEAAPH